MGRISGLVGRVKKIGTSPTAEKRIRFAKARMHNAKVTVRQNKKAIGAVAVAGAGGYAAGRKGKK